MNLVSSKHQVATLRELVCTYYSGAKNSQKEEDEAMEMWICRQGLVDDFKAWVI